MNPLDTPSAAPLSNDQYPQLNHDNPLSPKGRFTRLSFLAWNGVIGLIFSLSFLVIFIIGFGGVALAGISGSDVISHPLVIFAIILAVLAYIAFMVSMVCIMIRRLHDLNKSGWLWLVLLIPFVSLFFCIYVCVARGSKHSNTYGAFRPTEISEKYLGIAYAIFLGIFIVLYAVILSFMVVSPDKFMDTLMQSDSALILNDADSSVNEQHIMQDLELNSNHQDIVPSSTEYSKPSRPAQLAEAEVTADEALAAAQDAVQAEKDAVADQGTPATP